MNALFNFPPNILCFLGGVILTVITVGLFLPNNHERSYHHWVHKFILLALCLSFAWLITLYPKSENILLAGHFIWSPLTALLCIMLIGLSVPVFIYAEESLVKGTTTSQDYYILSLLSLFGAFSMLSAGSLFSFYLGLEIMSLASYGMVGLASKEGLRIEATMKYIVMGMVSSVLLLYGFCLLYFVDPTFSMSTFPKALTSSTLLPQIGASLVLVGFLFKLGAAPFHFWVPDVYQGASITTTLFIATIPKFAAVGMGLRLFLDRLNLLTLHAQLLLLSIGLLSVIVGNLMTLMQVHMKRLLAYSSVAHMGFILLGLALPATHYTAVLFYGFSYCLMATILFGALTHLSHAGLEINTIHDLKGLNKQYPKVALLILLVMSAMAGIPPLLGFFSKFGVLYNLLKQDFYITAGLALLATVIGAYYYLRIIKSMYFEPPHEQPQALCIASFSMSQAMLACSAFILIGLSVSPGILVDVIGNSIYSKPLPIKTMQKDIAALVSKR